jgi:hypothetical protein
MPLGPRQLGGLLVGLAGPPVVGADGSWWLVGRDGEVERFRVDDSLVWSISAAAAIVGGSVADDSGALFIPTARDLVLAIEPNGHVRWRFRAPCGIIGSLCLVPGQGLALLGRDHAVYWLDARANLLLRAPMNARITLGPTAFGNKVLVGTEDGKIVTLTRQGKRQSTHLGGAITAASPNSAGAVVLAGGKAYGLDSDAQIVWSRADVVGIGVVTARGHEQPQSVAVVLSAAGQIEWLDRSGNTKATAPVTPALGLAAVAEMAATEQQAWVTDDAGTLREARVDRGCRSTKLANVPLMRPVLNLRALRVIVSSVGGGVWSAPIERDSRLQ